MKGMKIIVMFPGQGCQYVGMCKHLIAQFRKVKQIFDTANDVLGFNLLSMVLEGNMKDLMQGQNAHPAVVTASYALFAAFVELTGTKPICAVGHSLGEISALIAANAISFENGVRFVLKRGEIMHSVASEKRGCVGIVMDVEIGVLQDIVYETSKKEYVSITGYNSPKQFLVAGTVAAMRELEKKVSEANGEYIPFKMIPMKEDAPYHCDLMSGVVPGIREEVGKLYFREPEFEILSTVTGEIIQHAEDIPELLVKQLSMPVLWNQVMDKVVCLQPDCLIDIGPQQIMRNLVSENERVPQAFSFDDDSDRVKITDILCTRR